MGYKIIILLENKTAWQANEYLLWLFKCLSWDVEKR